MTPSEKYYEKNKEAVKAKARKSNKANKERNQLFLCEYLVGKKCALCPFANPLGLTFDHLKDKRLEVSQMAKASYGVETIKKEIAKCRILCFNCHMIEENRIKNSVKWRYFLPNSRLNRPVR